MTQRPFFWQVFPPFLAIVAAALAAGTIISCLSLRSFHFSHVKDSLQTSLRVGESAILDSLKSGNTARIVEQCDVTAMKSKYRLTLVSPDGDVICESSQSPEVMESHGNRPEIREAFAAGEGSAIRLSKTLGQEHIYVARRLDDNGKVLGVLRMAVAVEDINRALLWIYGRIFAGFAVLFLIVLVVSWLVSNKLTGPIGILKAHVDRMSSGDFSTLLEFGDSEPREIASLGASINEIQVQLDLRMKNIIHHKGEKDGIFASIMEGVIAIDEHGDIISINYAAYNMLELPNRKLKGERLIDIVRNKELQEFILCSLNDANSHQMDLDLASLGEIRYLSVKAAPLKIGSLEPNGAVLVINDISKLRRLENLRKEFVANVSHELKTPLTTIQGFAETLLNPAVVISEDREEYLKIILKNSNRISSIIDDLLMLSKLEQETDASEIFLSASRLSPVILNAIESCQAKADAHKIRIEFNLDTDPVAQINPNLIEQALINLLDNAIKYSDDGSTVVINLREDGESVVFEVKDFGFGIPKHLVPRLFERFYRVDKARSRKMGGTGLGLSIVKHIIIVHYGRLEVESEVNKGSLFRVILPRVLKD
jgi:two-component system phosphate regulon sensor histidine kinase PhoR